MSDSNNIQFEFPDPPPCVKPVPAIQCFDIRGSRVMIGAAGKGWRGDLRADNPLMRDGDLMVPVLWEADFYHSQDDGVEAIAMLHPVESVWVEQTATDDERVTAPRHLFERIIDIDAPAVRYPSPASEVLGLSGRRVWLWSGGDFKKDLRCVSEAHENAAGDIVINVCAEGDWYRWGRTGQEPIIDEAPIHLTWVEG